MKFLNRSDIQTTGILLRYSKKTPVCLLPTTEKNIIKFKSHLFQYSKPLVTPGTDLQPTMLEDQEEFISSFVIKMGDIFTAGTFSTHRKTAGISLCILCRINIIQIFSENLTKNKRGISNGCIPQRSYLFRPGSYFHRLIHSYLGCGKEITNKDVVKGSEYDKDKHVIVTGDDFEKIKAEKNRSIQILHFAGLSSIRPIYYDKTYHAVPEGHGNKNVVCLSPDLVCVVKYMMKTASGSLR